MHSIESLRHLVEEMLAKSKRIMEYSRNSSATGLHRERIVESFIKRIAPKSFGIGSGFIYGSSQSSKQIDILVYDNMNFAPLFDEGGYVIVLPESVVEIIEVKSYLDKTQLLGALENVMSATKLNPKIQGSIFGFDGLSKEKAFEHISSFYQENKNISGLVHLLPKNIVNLGNWVISCIPQGDAICFVAPRKFHLKNNF